MMFNLLMIGAAWSLKVSNRVAEDYDMCSQDSADLQERDRIQPWRVRAICNEENSERLEEYLEVSARGALSLDEEIEFVGRCGSKCKARNEAQRLAKLAAERAAIGSKLYQGKFCGQSDPQRTSGLPIATFQYGHNTTDNATELDLEFKPNLCYNLECTGRCDIVDPSVKFECVAQDSTELTKATYSQLKATWFVTPLCKATSADGEYHYTKEQVAMVNSGSQDRFCFDASGDDDASTKDDKNMPVKPQFNDYYYQYSASSNQKLPVCPR